MSAAGDLADTSAGRHYVRLTAEQLRWRCPPVQPSANPPKMLELLGQERPLSALRTGLDITASGYHVFVSGLVGTGRTALVKGLLEELRPGGAARFDRVYLNNFSQPARPRLLSLPPGVGLAFQRDMEDVVLRTQDSLQAAVGSRPHKMSRCLVVQNSEVRQRRLMDALARMAEKEGCSLVQFESNGSLAADIYPICGQEAMSPQALCELVADGELSTTARDELLARRAALVTRLEEVSERIRRDGRRIEHELRGMDRLVAGRVVERHFDEFRAAWPQPQVAEYLDEVRDYVQRDLERWVAADDDNDGVNGGHGQHSSPRLSKTHLHELAVHVVHTCPESGGRPVVVETNPTYANLFGTIEPPRDMMGGLSMIHAGALLRADGGYLVLRAADVLTEPGVWQQLKRALKARQVEIREYDPGSGTTTGALQPEAIPIDLKVVLIGEVGMYEQLAAEDSQFLHTFKVHAEFDSTVPASEENLQRYADFLATMSREEGLRAFSPAAAAAVIELGARRAGRRDRLSTRFEEIADLGREAAASCGRNGPGPVEREHVQEAWRARQARLDLPREHVEHDLRTGYLIVETAGRCVGQLNGLTVYDTGTFAFGKPCRITASTGTGPKGRSRLVNIERESELSGPLHDKGVMILGGYLLDRFAQDNVLCLQATVCFEQNYGGVDGDSASSAELYALLSSLSKVPLHQGIGVTGSVNQKGEIQAVSGINEKIEGFFRHCRFQGLTGEQGVVIPRVNIPDLMLDEDVVEAVRADQFTVWVVDTIEQGLRVLTGMDANEVMERAAKTLDRFREQAG